MIHKLVLVLYIIAMGIIVTLHEKKYALAQA